jgi:hypothetical protein
MQNVFGEKPEIFHHEARRPEFSFALSTEAEEC